MYSWEECGKKRYDYGNISDLMDDPKGCQGPSGVPDHTLRTIDKDFLKFLQNEGIYIYIY